MYGEVQVMFMSRPVNSRINISFILFSLLKMCLDTVLDYLKHCQSERSFLC